MESEVPDQVGFECRDESRPVFYGGPGGQCLRPWQKQAKSTQTTQNHLYAVSQTSPPWQKHSKLHPDHSKPPIQCPRPAPQGMEIANST